MIWFRYFSILSCFSLYLLATRAKHASSIWSGVSILSSHSLNLASTPFWLCLSCKFLWKTLILGWPYEIFCFGNLPRASKPLWVFFLSILAAVLRAEFNHWDISFALNWVGFWHLFARLFKNFPTTSVSKSAFISLSFCWFNSLIICFFGNRAYFLLTFFPRVYYPARVIWDVILF